MGHKPLQDTIIDGIPGKIIAESCYNDIPVVSLFVQIVPNALDVRQVIPLIQCLDTFLGAEQKIDYKALDKSMEQIEKEMANIIKSMESPKPQSSATQSMYL